jgi:hypothetical protein
MADVTIPFGDNPSDTATLLLAAAEEAGQDASVVRTSGDGEFIVDEELAKAAGVGDGNDEEPAEEPSKPAKRTRKK